MKYYTRIIKRIQKKREGVGVYILIFLGAMILFSFLWAIFGYEVFPQYQAFQTSTFPSGVYIVTQLNFMGQMVVWFPLVILWSGGLYLWSNAQNKNSGADFPGQ